MNENDLAQLKKVLDLLSKAKFDGLTVNDAANMVTTVGWLHSYLKPKEAPAIVPVKKQGIKKGKK